MQTQSRRRNLSTLDAESIAFLRTILALDGESSLSGKHRNRNRNENINTNINTNYLKARRTLNDAALNLGRNRNVNSNLNVNTNTNKLDPSVDPFDVSDEEEA